MDDDEEMHFAKGIKADGKVAFVWRLRKMVRFAFVCNGVRFLSNSKERCL
jgi:hypothetical protein